MIMNQKYASLLTVLMNETHFSKHFKQGAVLNVPFQCVNLPFRWQDLEMSTIT